MLTRKVGETIILDDGIDITLIDFQGNHVSKQIGIKSFHATLISRIVKENESCGTERPDPVFSLCEMIATALRQLL